LDEPSFPLEEEPYKRQVTKPQILAKKSTEFKSLNAMINKQELRSTGQRSSVLQNRINSSKPDQRPPSGKIIKALKTTG